MHTGQIINSVCSLSDKSRQSYWNIEQKRKLCPTLLFNLFSAHSNNDNVLIIIVFMRLNYSKPIKAKVEKAAAECLPAPLWMLQDSSALGSLQSPGCCVQTSWKYAQIQITQKTLADLAWFEDISIQCSTLKEKIDFDRGVVLTIINNCHKNKERYKCKFPKSMLRPVVPFCTEISVRVHR